MAGWGPRREPRFLYLLVDRRLPVVSSLWTPGGERPVGRPAEPSRHPISEPPATDEEVAAEVEAMRAELINAPVEMVVANHCYGLFELAAVYLSQQPALLPQARLAIDALGVLVDGLAGRLGEAESSLRDGLAQLRMAYVQIDGAQQTGEAAASCGRRERRRRDRRPGRGRIPPAPKPRPTRRPPRRPPTSDRRRAAVTYSFERGGAGNVTGRPVTRSHSRRLAPAPVASTRHEYVASSGSPSAWWALGPISPSPASSSPCTCSNEHPSALAVTFALTADRLVSWLTFPIAGRLSDRTRSHIGRRTPYMGGSLIVLGAATWMFTVVHGYWQLVLFIVIAGQAASVFTLTNVTVVPEVFGRSRWIKALLLTTVLGHLASLSIKATVIATWKQSDPATWNLPFQVAAVIMVVVGLVVIVLVREAPAAVVGAASDRSERAVPLREQLREILAVPNAKVLITGSLLFWSGVGSTAYVAILFFQRVVHAGASAQTIAGLATGLPAFFIGIALGVPLSRLLTPKQLAVGAPLAGAVLLGVQYFDTHIWQAVVLSLIGAPLVGAYLIALAPMLLQLFPRGGGLGERLGILLSPFNLCSVALAYVAAGVIDATGNYRLIWLFPAATGIAHATVNCWLRVPPKRTTGSDAVTRVWEWSIVQAEAMAESGIVTGLLAAPLLGIVTEEDADSAVVVDLARNILGNPYESGQ